MSIYPYDGIDAAADWYPEGGVEEWTRLPLRMGRPRLDMAAHDVWKVAWHRGLISDVDLAWYTMLVNRLPGSWMWWLNMAHMLRPSSAQESL